MPTGILLQLRPRGEAQDRHFSAINQRAGCFCIPESPLRRPVQSAEVSKLLQARRVRVVIAIAMMICLLALLVPHAASHASVLACILFVPLLLLGLLDLPWLLDAAAHTDSALPPQAPVFSTLFQRPPPSLD